MKYFLSSIVLLLLMSCQEREVSDKTSVNNIKLELSDPLILKLDSVTELESYNIQHVYEDGREVLAFWSRVNNAIVFFDLNTRKSYRRQVIPRTGPNANNSNQFGFISRDSVILTDAFRTTYLVNSKSEVLSTFPVVDGNEVKYPGDPWVRTHSPMTFVDGKIYYQAYVGGIFNQPNMAVLDLSTREIEYFSGFPKFYLEAYWRGGFEYMYYAFNPDQQTFIYSFVADHNLRIQPISNLDTTYTHEARAEGFGQLTPPRKNMSDPGYEFDERKFMLQPSYGPILYDRFRDAYYRFAFDAISASDFDSGDEARSIRKPVRIIVLDRNLNKVGEKGLDRFRYNVYMSFVSEQGLNIKVIENEQEDQLLFDFFKPVRLQ